MANLQKFRAHESENTQAAGGWSQQTVLDVGATTVTVDVSSYHNIHLQTSQDIYFTFNTTTTDIIASANSLYLKGGDTIYELTVPYGLGSDTIYLHALRKTSSDSTVRLVYT